MRAIGVPVLALLAVTGYLVGAGALAASNTSDTIASTEPQVANTWKAGYSERFPGCVASVLWPATETPVAIVVRWRSGAVDRVVMRGGSEGSFVPSPGGVEIIGACYRRR